MINLQLNYRYRDVHNYKQFGAVVFSNPSEIAVEEATVLLLPKLISGFEETIDPVTDERDILVFLEGDGEEV